MTDEAWLSDTQHIEHTKMLDAASFTPREVDILACLVHKKSDKDIALLLSIGTRTVHAHLYRAMEKIGCHSRKKMVHMIQDSTVLSVFQQRYSNLLNAQEADIKAR